MLFIIVIIIFLQDESIIVLSLAFVNPSMTNFGSISDRSTEFIFIGYELKALTAMTQTSICLSEYRGIL
jgi:hypothetical protein